MDVVHYEDEICFKQVEKLIKKGNQVNVVKVFCEKTSKDCVRLIEEAKYNKKLKGLNSIVFLVNKPKKKNSKKLNQIKDILIFYSRSQGIDIEFK